MKARLSKWASNGLPRIDASTRSRFSVVRFAHARAGRSDRRAGRLGHGRGHPHVLSGAFANEGYLRTATERRSVIELARLIGYALRPGVASSVYLAYTLDTDRSERQAPGDGLGRCSDPQPGADIPGPGRASQSFETSELLAAQDTWNNLKPRLKQPAQDAADDTSSIVKGMSTNLKPNDRLLIDFGSAKSRRRPHGGTGRRADRTKLTLDGLSAPQRRDRQQTLLIEPRSRCSIRSSAHRGQPTGQPCGSRQPEHRISPTSDLVPGATTGVSGHEVTEDQLYKAMENARDFTPRQPVAVHAFRAPALGVRPQRAEEAGLRPEQSG